MRHIAAILLLLGTASLLAITVPSHTTTVRAMVMDVEAHAVMIGTPLPTTPPSIVVIVTTPPSGHPLRVHQEVTLTLLPHSTLLDGAPVHLLAFAPVIGHAELSQRDTQTVLLRQ